MTSPELATLFVAPQCDGCDETPTECNEDGTQWLCTACGTTTDVEGDD